MKLARIPQAVIAPDHWTSLPWGKYYREAIEKKLEPWFSKMYGLHLLKIGNLSAEINSENCTITHQINVSISGQSQHVIADPLYLPFSEKSVDACLMAHILPWCHDPHRLLREADRVLIDNGWLVLSSFNPTSLMGLYKFSSVLHKHLTVIGRMFTIMRQLDWLSLLNFEVLHYSCFHVLPWTQQGGKLLNTHFHALGCLQLIITRKRTVPLKFNLKQHRMKPKFSYACRQKYN